MTYYIDLQIETADTLPLSEDDLILIAETTLKEYRNQAELTIRLVDSGEIRDLNQTYRKIDKPTNVLAFPMQLPEGIDLEVPLLGDVIVCPEVLDHECKEQHKEITDHWAHIVVHGILHLLGYDHIEEPDAEKMQAEEIKILAKLGYPNPYHDIQEETSIE